MDRVNIKLKELQDELNTTPCPYCGKKHSVSFIFNPDTQQTQITYSEDCCAEFLDYAVRKSHEVSMRNDVFSGLG